MTNQDAISKAISIVQPAVGSIVVYPYDRPKTITGKELIVINTLGLPADVFQKGIMNVNIHVPDISGFINNKRLNDIATMVKAAFNTYDNDSSNKIFFKEDFELIIQEEGEHILNLRYKVFMLNNL